MSRSIDVAIIQRLTPQKIKRLSADQILMNIGLAIPFSAEERQQCQLQLALLEERYDFLTKQKESQLKPKSFSNKSQLVKKNQPQQADQPTNYVSRFFSGLKNAISVQWWTISKGSQDKKIPQVYFQVDIYESSDYEENYQLDHFSIQPAISGQNKKLN